MVKEGKLGQHKSEYVRITVCNDTNWLQRLDTTKEAFNLIRRVEDFCECARIGSDKHIKIMKSILDSDPKKQNLYRKALLNISRHIIEKIDPDHILNKRDCKGLTPLYIAAQNGNLNVVKFLIEYGTPHGIESHVRDKYPTFEFNYL